MIDLLQNWGFIVELFDKNGTSGNQIPNLKPITIIFQFMEFSNFEFEEFNSHKKIYGAVPLIATSPYVSIKNIIKVMQCGASDYLPQPFTPKDLLGMITKYTKKDVPN